MKRILPLTAAALLALAAPVIAEAPLKPVKLMTAEIGGTALTRQFFGQVAAKETVDLAFQVGGQIVDFPVIEGELIREGDLVARLDPETFDLTLEQARLQRDQAKRKLERLERLADSTASQVTIDDAATALGLAEVALRNAQYAKRHATLPAPFDALVATRNVANFTTISAGTPVVRLHDMSELRIEVDVPEVLFLRSRGDSNVRVSAKFPSSEETFPLIMREFNAETSKVGQTFRVTFAMKPPEGLHILPGASVTVIANAKGEFGDAIILPKSAVFIDNDGKTAVMLFKPEGEAQGSIEKALVEVRPAPEEGIMVISGLDAGSEVVVTGAAALADGQRVRRFVGFGN